MGGRNPHDLGLSDAFVDELRASLPPGSSAVSGGEGETSVGFSVGVSLVGITGSCVGVGRPPPAEAREDAAAFTFSFAAPLHAAPRPAETAARTRMTTHRA